MVLFLLPKSRIRLETANRRGGPTATAVCPRSLYWLARQRLHLDTEVVEKGIRRLLAAVPAAGAGTVPPTFGNRVGSAFLERLRGISTLFEHLTGLGAAGRCS